MAKKINNGTKIVSESTMTLGDILSFIRENSGAGDVDAIADTVIEKMKASGLISDGTPGVSVDVSVCGKPVVGVDVSGKPGKSGKCAEGAGEAWKCCAGYRPAATVSENLAAKSAPNIASKSKFFKMVLANGEVFCPYTDRRFLPAQYLGMMSWYDGNVDKAIAVRYTIDSVWKLLRYEMANIAWMEKHWTSAFNERSEFFTIDDCKQILHEYLGALSRNINDRSKCKYNERKGEFFRKIRHLGNVILWTKTEQTVESGTNLHEETNIDESSWLRSLNVDITRAIESVRSARTYSDLVAVVDKMPKIHMGTYRGKDGTIRNWQPATWRVCFKKAGAYYTLKSLIRDGIVRLSTDAKTCGGVVSSLNELKKLSDGGVQGYVVHAILKKSIADAGTGVDEILKGFRR